MRHYLLAMVLIATAGTAGAQTPPAPARNHDSTMTLSSPDIADGGIIPDKNTAKSVLSPATSPALSWTATPAGTQSFVLIMHDLDVMAGKSPVDNLHWMMFNIPGTATSLPSGIPTNIPVLPDGTVQLRRGNSPNYAYGYSGPGAPAPIYHHYIFELWALDTKLALNETATRADVMNAIEGHILDKGVLFARFHR